MVFAPVGIRCPDHAGVAQGAQRVTRGVRRAAYEGSGALVTKVLIGINLAVYALNLAQGSTLNRTSGWLFDEGALVILAPWGGVGDGEWWRLITAAFLHGSIIHVALNMVVLWVIGAPVEEAIGRGRFLALYLISGLSGSAGALLSTRTRSPSAPPERSSGSSAPRSSSSSSGTTCSAVAPLVSRHQPDHHVRDPEHLDRRPPRRSRRRRARGTGSPRFGRTHAIYGRHGLLGAAGLVGSPSPSVALAYWRVESLL